ncbi:S-adenosyl-L-methionine-dependent methyltransferase, partial [Pyronema domesticum]
TSSLTSSVHQYLFQHGRRYHAYYGRDKYLMPMDEKEQDRLDLHHEIMRLLWDDRLHESPLDQPDRILDIGVLMAEVIGTDLSPIQPNRFEVDDATLEWFYKENSFDFIHSRNICSGISDWDHLQPHLSMTCLTSACICTNPGGYVELCEYSITINCGDGTMKPDNSLKIWMDSLRESMTKMGRPPPNFDHMKQLLEKAGFEDVHASEVKEPMGPWPKGPRGKRIGAMVLLNCETGIESYAMAAFTRVLGMEVEKARALCDGALSAARNKNYFMYGKYYRVYGRKPKGVGVNDV